MWTARIVVKSLKFAINTFFNKNLFGSLSVHALLKLQALWKTSTS